MKFESLKANRLSKEELLAIKAGSAPDCDGGTILQHVPGTGYVCVPLEICEWVITDPPPPPGS